MGHNFLSIATSSNEFVELKSPGINEFVLENNEVVLRKVYGAFQKNTNVLLLTGFFGTGKSQIVAHLMNYIDRSVYSLNFYCATSTRLDDIMLNIWAQLIMVAPDNELKPHSIAFSFQEKINTFFSDSSSCVILNLFDFDLVSEENAIEIIDFISLVSQNDNVRVVITAKTFDTTKFSDDVNYSKLMLKALNRVVFEKYIQSSGIRATSRIVDELYKITRGYYFYTDISIKILTQKNLSVSDYLVAYTNSGMSFDKFLAKAFVSMLPLDVKKTFLLLSQIRHATNSQVLDCLNAYDNYAIEYLSTNKFIKLVDDMVVINNYFVQAVQEEYSEDDISKCHIELIKFYNDQLALKPSERAILLSRNTMRSELDYHKSLSGKIEKSEPVVQDVTKNILANNYSIDELLATASELKENYKYSDAVKIYLSLLENETKFESINLKYKIFEELADLYNILTNWKYALHYYDFLIAYYKEIANTDKIDFIKIKIANIYYQSYKTTEAINLLYEIISESVNSKITIEAYTMLGNIYISLAAKAKAYDLYSKALTLSERESDLNNLSELYFKFAILSDEKDETESAIKYYKKCIESSSDNDKYKALSYSNLGDLNLDYAKLDEALEMFKGAYKYDSINKNYYGMYYAASNIAKLIVNKEPTEALDYLIKAKNAAVKSNDLFAIANSGLHLGDYYCNNDSVEYGIREYFYVLNLVKDKFREDNKKKIFARLEDAKCRIGIDKYTELVKQYG